MEPPSSTHLLAAHGVGSLAACRPCRVVDSFSHASFTPENFGERNTYIACGAAWVLRVAARALTRLVGIADVPGCAIRLRCADNCGTRA